MADLQGVFSFPGIERVISGKYTQQWGISPGVIMLDIVPQETLDTTDGNVTISFGSDVKKVIPKCRVDRAQLSYDERGFVTQVFLFDRRWQWRECGAISGKYNQYRDNGALDRNSEKTPQQLAKLCAAAMGESNADVDALVNTARPEVDWSYANPANALQELCEQLGCAITVDGDFRLTIVQTGNGSALPEDDDLMSFGAEANPPEKPSSLTCATGIARFEYDFELEPVGEEQTDSSLKRIDDLKYKPKDGWYKSDPLKAPGGITDEVLLPLALSCILRWYAIKASQFPIQVEGYGQVDALWQILPLETIQATMISVEIAQPGALGLTQTREIGQGARVWGAWAVVDLLQDGLDRPKSKGNSTKSDDGNKAPDDPTFDTIIKSELYSIDTDLGVVKFSTPVYYLTGDSTTPYAASDLRLRCAFSIRESDTRAFYRYTVNRVLQGGISGTKPKFIHRNDLVLSTQQDGTDNQSDIDQGANIYLDGAEAEYDIDASVNATYRGIRDDFELDGAIRSITWEVSQQGYAYTYVSWNDERTNPATVPFKRRRQLEKIGLAQPVLLPRQQAKVQAKAGQP